MWDNVFNICVDILVFLGDITELTYNEINVLVFCIIWPLYTIYLLLHSYKARRALYLFRNPDSNPKRLPFLFPALGTLFNIKNK